MHAIVRRRYGTPDVLSYEEIPRPVAGEHDVLVRVCAAGASIGDHHVVTGQPYVVRPAIGGLIRPGHLVPGSAMAGRVEAAGATSTRRCLLDTYLDHACRAGARPRSGMARRSNRMAMSTPSATSIDPQNAGQNTGMPGFAIRRGCTTQSKAP